MEEGVHDGVQLCFYPFLSAATRYVAATGIRVEDLLTSAALERARARGRDRIRDALREGTIRKPVIMSSAQAELELLSYPFARILVSCIGDAHLVRRYALAEAKGAYQRLLEEFTAAGSREPEGLYEFAQEFGISVRYVRAPPEPAEVLIPFEQYLHHTLNLRDKRWKLVNRGLEQGEVKLRPVEFLRILQEAFYERIKRDLPLKVPPDLCNSVRPYLLELQTELEIRRQQLGDRELAGELGVREKDPGSFPPCITAILGNLREGVNVPHTARFAVTAFLLNIGLTVDEVIELYRNSPDFEEERTRYQVVHISGEQGSTRYSAPSCDTMRTYGNCVGNDEVCERITHPLSYYKRKLWLKRKTAAQEGEKKA
jgi:DNA primase large subunit